MEVHMCYIFVELLFKLCALLFTKKVFLIATNCATDFFLLRAQGSVLGAGMTEIVLISLSVA